MTTALIIFGLSLLITGPILFIVVRGLRAERVLVQRDNRLLREGHLVTAQVVTVGQSTASAAYPGNCSFLHIELRLSDAFIGSSTTSVVSFDQAIPKLAVGAIAPGSQVKARVLAEGGQLLAIVDTYAMGYR
ncbi:MAG: hypothetical protein QM784_32785 [Polyangiaceae bacterium]